MIFTYINYFKNTDVEFDNLDFQRDDQLASFCRERLNRITERTLNVLLLGYKIILLTQFPILRREVGLFAEMRKADRDRDMVLPPSTVDELIHKYKLPLTPCLPFLHKKFRGEAKKTLNRYHRNTRENKLFYNWRSNFFFRISHRCAFE